MYAELVRILKEERGIVAPARSAASPPKKKKKKK